MRAPWSRTCRVIPPHAQRGGDRTGALGSMRCWAIWATDPLTRPGVRHGAAATPNLHCARAPLAVAGNLFADADSPGAAHQFIAAGTTTPYTLRLRATSTAARIPKTIRAPGASLRTSRAVSSTSATMAICSRFRATTAPPRIRASMIRRTPAAPNATRRLAGWAGAMLRACRRPRFSTAASTSTIRAPTRAFPTSGARANSFAMTAPGARRITNRGTRRFGCPGTAPATPIVHWARSCTTSAGCGRGVTRSSSSSPRMRKRTRSH